jgi:hypothetical protein
MLRRGSAGEGRLPAGLFVLTIVASNAVVVSCFTQDHALPPTWILADVFTYGDAAIPDSGVPADAEVDIDPRFAGDASLDELLAAPCADTCRRLTTEAELQSCEAPTHDSVEHSRVQIPFRTQRYAAFCMTGLAS